MSAASQFFGGGGGSSVPAAQGGPVSPGITVAEVLLVGGGGDGDTGTPTGSGRGGQGGSVLSSTAIFFTQGTSYTITIGGAASNSSIAGGTLNLVARGGNPGTSAYRSESGRKLDEYTTVYALDGLPSGVQYGYGNRGGGGAISEGRVVDSVSTPSVQPGGAGGEGLYSLISASSTNYGSGGGGGGIGNSDNGFQTFVTATPGGAGGSGGASGGPGGPGAPGPTTGTNGVANSGGGGGGGGGAKLSPSPIAAGPGGSGGSGICIIRWPTAYPDAPAVSGNTPTPAQPGYRVYRWNSGPGSITF
jgi:hypothetical protein